MNCAELDHDELVNALQAEIARLTSERDALKKALMLAEADKGVAQDRARRQAEALLRVLTCERGDDGCIKFDERERTRGLSYPVTSWCGNCQARSALTGETP